MHVDEQEYQAMVQDAHRYRWLRTMWCHTILEDLLDRTTGRNPEAELDNAIDAAGAASLGRVDE